MMTLQNLDFMGSSLQNQRLLPPPRSPVLLGALLPPLLGVEAGADEGGGEEGGGVEALPRPPEDGADDPPVEPSRLPSRRLPPDRDEVPDEPVLVVASREPLEPPGVLKRVPRLVLVVVELEDPRVVDLYAPTFGVLPDDELRTYTGSEPPEARTFPEVRVEPKVRVEPCDLPDPPA
jgi:hypothetical protein